MSTPELERHDDDNDDHLREDAREGVDLPKATLDTLVNDGVPRELRLPDWEGPTLFSSELGTGRLASTSDPGALVTRTGDHEGYVIGAVRDVESKLPYSAFVVRKKKGDVWLLDTSRPEDDRFVNASLEAFLASMHAFHTGFTHLMDTLEDEERQKLVASFRGLLNKLDPRALQHPDHYWPGWMEELERF